MVGHALPGNQIWRKQHLTASKDAVRHIAPDRAGWPMALHWNKRPAPAVYTIGRRLACFPETLMKVRYLIVGLLLAVMGMAACSTNGGMNSQGNASGSPSDNSQNLKSYRGGY